MGLVGLLFVAFVLVVGVCGKSFSLGGKSAFLVFCFSCFR